MDNFRHEADANLSTRLPDTLERWATVQISALSQQTDDNCHPRPLQYDGPGGRLVARLVADREPGRYLVILHLATPIQSAQPS